ncbi:unnamed protein product [Angiostrongylus costaricensis]|uniref:Uncharacterized protein n=1 Tax=Angiostrongylus costaricensis TaxID=334426 RepID=A0A0R3Q176_ANGCS|nr:unnamed protein product [Angiostrongylus costaricensis]
MVPDPDVKAGRRRGQFVFGHGGGVVVAFVSVAVDGEWKRLLSVSIATSCGHRRLATDGGQKRKRTTD